jgi:hypothetical protein
VAGVEVSVYIEIAIIAAKIKLGGNKNPTSVKKVTAMSRRGMFI